MCILMELREYARRDYDPVRAEVLSEAANIIRSFQIFYASVEDALNPNPPEEERVIRPMPLEEIQRPREIPPVPDTLMKSRVHAEKQHLREVLHRHSNNRTAVARELKISRTALYKKLRKHNLMEK